MEKLQRNPKRKLGDRKWHRGRWKGMRNSEKQRVVTYNTGTCSTTHTNIGFDDAYRKLHKTQNTSRDLDANK